jgi:hypothetical protein
MSEWKEMDRQTIDGVLLIVHERTDSRNRHGATEYEVEAKIDGDFVCSRRVPWNVWSGLCSGQLLLPEVAAQAKRIRSRQECDVATELDRSSVEAFQKSSLVIAVWGDKSYIVKSRDDLDGITHKLPHRPDVLVAYFPGSRDIDQVARTQVLHLISRRGFDDGQG